MLSRHAAHPRNRRLAARDGFTLVELSIVLIIMAFIASSAISFATSRIQAANLEQTTAKLDAIENALLSYRIVNGRIPCPARPTIATTAATFGMEAGVGGDCNNGAADIRVSGNVNEGVVPVRTLQLPDDFMFDAWGRRMLYAVDERYTLSDGTAFTAATQGMTDGTGGITVNDRTGAARDGGVTTSKAIVLILSFGEDGHGAFLRSGSATRYSAGASLANQLENCDCDNTATATAYDAIYVQTPPEGNSATTTFDDMVRYRTRWQIAKPSEKGITP